MKPDYIQFLESKIKLSDRKAIITELNETYAKCGNQYLKEEELKRDVPTLFDLLTTDKAA